MHTKTWILQGLLVGALGLAWTWNAAAQSTPIPSGSHIFSSGFDATSSEVYSDNSTRVLGDGWSGYRNPAGDHGGSPGTSDMASSLLQYRGGQGGSSDDLRIESVLSSIPVDYKATVRFRRDGAHCTARTDFQFVIGGTVFIVDSGSGNDTGVSGGSTASFALTTGVFYLLEIINGDTDLEVRIWEDGQSRPSTPLVVDTALTTAPTLLQLRGGNFCAPSATVDWVVIDDLSPAVPAFSAGGHLLTTMLLLGIGSRLARRSKQR
jgi:hypothetical protein